MVGVVVILVAGSIFAWPLLEVGCRADGRGATAKAAIEAYYARCRTTIELHDFGDADLNLDGLTGWHATKEYSVDYDGKTRFVILGQRRLGSDWEVIGGEGSGP